MLASASLLGCDIGRDQVDNVQPDPRASTAGIRPQTPAPVTDQPSKPPVAPPKTATATPPAGG
ncbi:MAG TPA: hypothetical protein VKP11_03935 [Frankiaceae bacterium]|nr:hypothetical protein [Frankiaceae bacterium]